jgi:hypothetical protein
MSIFRVLTSALSYYSNHGYTDQTTLNQYTNSLKAAIVYYLMRPKAKNPRDLLQSSFDRFLKKSTLRKKEINNIYTDLSRELHKRQAATDELIKYRKEESILQVLRRFVGWATSIPKGGIKDIDKVKEKDAIRKEIFELPLVESRIINDQTRKMESNLNELIAIDNGAIAAKWHSQWRTPDYNYREPHKSIDVDADIFVIRNSWAHKDGLIKEINGYTDDRELPGQLPNCKCVYHYLYKLTDLPKEMLTKKGLSLTK